LVVVLGLVISACKKDKIDLNVSSQQNSSSESPRPKTVDGVLNFDSEEHLYNYLEKCSEISDIDRISLEESFDFLSLGTLYNRIINEENEHQEKFYSGYDPNLSIKEYESLRLFYENSPIYKKYLDLGVIYEKDENGGAKSFNLSIDNPGFLNVLNEDGSVIVGKKKYIFKGSEISIIDNITGEVLNNISYNNKATSEWTHGGAWEELSSTQRISYKVYHYCITSSEGSSSGLIQSTFYVHAQAQNKKFGTWGFRSSYLPIYSFSANWSAGYKAKSCYYCLIQENPVFLNDNDPVPPAFSWHSSSDPNGQTNNFLRYLKPNGSWALDGWYITSVFNINYTMHFTFSGGSSGHLRSLYRY